MAVSEQVARQAKFLLGWAKGKQITKLQANSIFHKSGKWMTKIDAETSQAMLDAGLTTGNLNAFKMNKAAVNALGG